MSTIAGSKNTLLGYGAALPNAAASNQIVIGTQAETTHIAGGGVIISQSALTLSGNTALTVSGNAGAAGQYMVTGGAGQAPYWGPKAPQSLTGVSWTLANPLSNLYKIQGDGNVEHEWSLTLPSAASAAGSSIWLKNMATASGIIGASIVNEGAAGAVGPLLMSPGDSGNVESNGTNWYVLSSNQKFAIPVPTVTRILPAFGSTNGGTLVTITGRNFTGTPAVTVGGTPAGSVNLVGSTTITALTASRAAGLVNVSVTTPVGTGTGIGLYTYETTPTVTGISPSFGIIGGGTSVTITGTGFLGATAVSVGGAVSYTVVNDTTITAQTGVGVAGPAAVSVTTPEGTGTGTGLYTYVSALFINTGANQTWQVPTGVTQVTATVAGSSSGYQGGCTITGVLTTTPSDTLTIVCGGTNYGGQGNNNGGQSASNGGGFSAILKSTAAVNANGQPTANFPGCIYVMAAGSGGPSHFSKNTYGGFTQGGGENNYIYGRGGVTNVDGTGTGGAGGEDWGSGPGNSGSQFKGGDAPQVRGLGAGSGGGGYYGGGSGAPGSGSGGGGSSYPVADTGIFAIMSHTDGSNGGTGYVTLTWT